MIDRSGQQLDNYYLLTLLGRGSFGEVYLAEHVVRKTQAAIKIFNIDSNQVNQPDMLEEISNLVRLNGHPNIIRIAGFSVKPPAPFIVMDYAPNGTLVGRHPRGMPVPLATVMTYVKQIASALQYAHEENLIHRDVKPANILVAQDGTLRLSDFGITIPSQSMLVAHRRLQDFAGTPEYMAPEQIQFLPSRASDQYALAILVYEWLTGYPPFMGNQGDILNKHLSIVPAPLPNIVPNGLATVVMKALSKNPKDRYPTIQDFASALEQAYNEILQRTQTPTLVEPPPPLVVNRKRKTKEQWLNEGNKLYHAERYDEAVAAYTKVLELDPAYAGAYIGRGSAYYRLKQYEQVVHDCSKAIELDPTGVDGYIGRGSAYYHLKQYEQVVYDCSKAIELDSAYATVYNRRGIAYHILKQYEAAVRDFTTALELNPTYATAYYNRGVAYLNLKQYEAAMRDFTTAIELNPIYAKAYYNRGIAHDDLKNYEQAIADYDRALALDPNYTLARKYRERALRMLQEEQKKSTPFWRRMFGMEE